MSKLVKGLAGACFLVVATSGCDAVTDMGMSSIHDQVTEDVVAQYEIARAQGDPMQRCVQAGIVSAAFLQAQDTAEYNRWKDIESADCRAAGLPR